LAIEIAKITESHFKYSKASTQIFADLDSSFLEKAFIHSCMLIWTLKVAFCVSTGDLIKGTANVSAYLNIVSFGLWIVKIHTFSYINIFTRQI